MSVLILADERDPTADAMVQTLGERGVAVCRVDIGWFPDRLCLDAELHGGAWRGHLRTPVRRIDLSEVSAVWLRSPTAFRFPARWSSVERRHAHHEARFGLGGVLASLPVFWIDHPARVADAVSKPAQLAVATQVGMRVPDTAITNDAAAVRRFAADAPDGTVLTKMLGAPAITEEGRRKVAFTRRVHRGDLDDLGGVERTAHQFQRWIPKAHDLRVVVVGRRHWAVAITADTDAGRLDFRADYGALHYELVPEPDGLHTMIDAYMARFRLVYAALDFVVDLDGRCWFLEANAGGQYGWLERATGAPITSALADALAAGRAP